MLQLSYSSHNSLEYIPAIINAYSTWVEEWITKWMEWISHLYFVS